MWFISFIVVGIPVMSDPSPQPSPYPVILDPELSPYPVMIDPLPELSPYPVIYRYEDRKIAAKHVLKMDEDQLSLEALLQFTDKQVDRILGRLHSYFWIVSEQ